MEQLKISTVKGAYTKVYITNGIDIRVCRYSNVEAFCSVQPSYSVGRPRPRPQQADQGPRTTLYWKKNTQVPTRAKAPSCSEGLEPEYKNLSDACWPEMSVLFSEYIENYTLQQEQPGKFLK